MFDVEVRGQTVKTSVFDQTPIEQWLQAAEQETGTHARAAHV